MYKNIKLKQRNLLSSREIKVNNNTDLTLIEKSIYKKQEVPISLEVIDPKPYSHKSFATKPLILSLLVIGITAILFNHYFDEQFSEDKSFVLAMSITMLIITILAIINVINKSSKLLVYTNATTGNNMFVISASKPNTVAVNEFVSGLEKRIKSIKYPENMPQEKKIEIYKRHVLYLYDEKVITKNEAESIYDRLNDKEQGKNVFKIV